VLARLGVFLILFALFKATGKARHVLEHPISLTLQLLLQGFQVQAPPQHWTTVTCMPHTHSSTSA
jgi:hypothetical protein